MVTQQLLLHAACCCSALIITTTSSLSSSLRISSLSSSRNQHRTPLRAAALSIDDTSAATTSSLRPATIMATNDIDLQVAIAFHLNEAAKSQSKGEFTSQRIAMESAERVLNQWVELSRGKSSSSSGNVIGSDISSQPLLTHPSLPGANVFNSIIQGFLSLPSSSITIAQYAKEEEEEVCITDNCEEELNEKNQIKSLLRKKGVGGGGGGVGGNRLLQQYLMEETNSDRATRILDFMESYYEPTPEVYDAIIASQGKCALEYLAQISTIVTTSGDDNGLRKEGGRRMTMMMGEDQSKHHSLFYSQALKSAKAALQLLNRSEDLYRETGQPSERLPSVSSYVTLMDVFKALAVNSAELLLDSKKSRDEAINVWKNLRQRRLEMYRLNDDWDADHSSASSAAARGSKLFKILPNEVIGSVEDTFYHAYNLLRESSASYAEESEMIHVDRIGTYHFNQLIFDLAKYPQKFSGLLAQDLLEFMVSMVRELTINFSCMLFWSKGW